jgi:hypothetical protein
MDALLLLHQTDEDGGTSGRRNAQGELSKGAGGLDSLWLLDSLRPAGAGVPWRRFLRRVGRSYETGPGRKDFRYRRGRRRGLSRFRRSWRPRLRSRGYGRLRAFGASILRLLDSSLRGGSFERGLLAISTRAELRVFPRRSRGRSARCLNLDSRFRPHDQFHDSRAGGPGGILAGFDFHGHRSSGVRRRSQRELIAERSRTGKRRVHARNLDRGGISRFQRRFGR